MIDTLEYYQTELNKYINRLEYSQEELKSFNDSLEYYQTVLNYFIDRLEYSQVELKCVFLWDKEPVPSIAGQAVAGGTISALNTTTAFIAMGRYFP